MSAHAEKGGRLCCLVCCEIPVNIPSISIQPLMLVFNLPSCSSSQESLPSPFSHIYLPSSATALDTLEKEVLNLTGTENLCGINQVGILSQTELAH